MKTELLHLIPDYKLIFKILFKHNFVNFLSGLILEVQNFFFLFEALHEDVVVHINCR